MRQLQMQFDMLQMEREKAQTELSQVEKLVLTDTQTAGKKQVRLYAPIESSEKLSFGHR